MPSKDSKTNFALLREKILQKSGKEYWRSVEEFVDAPEFEEFVKHEYPAHAEEWDDTLSRRNFVKVMGASLAFAGLSGCVIQPAEKIVPYVRQPEELVPGKPLFYATAMTLGGTATGLLARSNEGRPTKIEGNPEHPQSLGATDVRAQASILTMYDPDRSKEVLYRNTPRTWQNFMTEIRGAIEQNRADGGAGIRFLTETVTSPTLIGQFKQILSELPNAKLYQYEPVNNDNATAGAKMAFGAPVHTVYKFDQADRVLSLDKDIFSDFNVRYTKDYIKKRQFNEEQKQISRLYCVETTMSLTGAKADHRLAVKPSQVPEIAKAIAAALGISGASSTYTENGQWIQTMATDLLSNKGKSIVIVGDNQPPTVHALAHAMNAALGNVGTTVTYTEPFYPNADKLQVEQLTELIREIDGGAVKMLVILGGNPVYNTPIDLRLNEDRIKNKIPLRIHLGMYFDETAEYCQWHISEKHFLEMWSDTRAYDGTVTIVQPLIEPIYDSKSIHEVVQIFSKENFDKKDLDIVKEFWQKQGFAGAPKVSATTAGANQNGSGTTANTNNANVNNTAAPQAAATTNSNSGATTTQTPTTTGASAAPNQNAASTATRNFEDNWRKAVHDGFIANSAAATRSMSVNTGFMSQPENNIAIGDGLEISILPDPCVYDGRFANNGWLQELPNPLTKITWDNVALVSPNTAKRLELNQGVDAKELVGGTQGTTFVNTKGGNLFSDLVTLNYEGAAIDKPVPVWIAPGQPDDVITIYMGYGRTRAGRVGTGLGYNAFNIRKSNAMWFGAGNLNKTGEKTTIASSQIHFNMEGRDLLRVWDVNDFENEVRHGEQEDFYDLSMYPGFKYNGNKWGMTIDLNSCVGCNACVIACQSENNIPVVGKEQVERSREMHWMRIDAYYSGDINNPQGPSFQPVLCQQCEQAPCEVVCPVHATVHSAEGLNDMVYNRCIGTRYCSNNCPYKVRRFNFLLYQDWDTPQYKLMRNPEVSVRSRGVMEKCTYCTQRIASARIEAEKDSRNIRDGEIVTACQAVCPADAIVFGDLNDKDSQVVKLKNDHRNYVLLNELNTQPRTTYLAALKNQNKEMPDYRMPKIREDKLAEPNKPKTEGKTEH
ncbi:MAG: TAT-variant-translocated molybdopterin oxidoreductase [Pyrinomonadaceae bacterium]